MSVKNAIVLSLPSCDFRCGNEAEFDGATKSGPWAYMCPECWAEYGAGRLGLGYGQRLIISTS